MRRAARPLLALALALGGGAGCRRAPTIHGPATAGSAALGAPPAATISRGRGTWQTIPAVPGALLGRDAARGIAVGRALLVHHPVHGWVASYDPCSRRWREHEPLRQELRRVPALAVDPTHAAFCCGPPDRSGVLVDLAAAAPAAIPSMPQTPWPGRASEVVVDGLLVPTDKRFHLAERRWSVIPFDDAVYRANGQQGAAEASSGAHVLIFSGARFEPGRGEILASGGALFDAWRDVWRPLSTAGAPSPRRDAAAVWSGRDFVVYGGVGRGPGGAALRLRDGGRYDPAADRWSPIAAGPEFSGAIEAGLADDQVLLWDRDRVAAYDLGRGRWREVATPARTFAQDRVFGHGRLALLTPGDAYLLDARRLTWSRHPLPEALRGRDQRVQVMSATHLILWGGQRTTGSGGCEDPPPGVGCDPWTETAGQGDGAALPLATCPRG